MATTNYFGVALRGWRERLSPLESGLPADGDRRLKGLRREELARLAGLSVDYVVRLEQGRARSPSAQVVAALARALRLNAAERDHLFRCANLLPPATGEVSLRVPARAGRLMDRMAGTPVAIFAADWTLIGWNAMWTAVIGDPETYGWPERNLVCGMFRSVDGRRPEAIAAWPVRDRDGDEAEERALVADLRMTACAYPADTRLAGLIERTVHASPRFARLWSSGTVGALAEDHKIVEHPLVGSLDLDLEVLMLPGTDIRIVTYVPAPGTDAARKLNDLRDHARTVAPPAPAASRAMARPLAT